MRHSLSVLTSLLPVALAIVACPDRQEPAAAADAGEPPQPAVAKVAPKPSAATTALSPEARFPSSATLLLPQAQFDWEVGADGREHPTPGAAKLLMLTPEPAGWRVDTLEDPASRVFHKAMCVRLGDEARLLTIGGTEALLKLWRVQDGAWSAETLWRGVFGGKWDRLRDLEIGDVDNDGEPEMVVATHDQGVIAVVEQRGGAWTATEIYRAADTFIHEVELGDLDGDRRLEIYATPSKPNKADRSQPGGIMAFTYVGKKGGAGRDSNPYVRSQVASFYRSHAKEILTADLNGDGRDELYAAVEGERAGSAAAQPVEIRELLRDKRGRWKTRTVASLPGAVQSRVLLAADLTGRGHPDLVVTTMTTGIWRLVPSASPKKPWATVQIAVDTSGFEHAAGVADLDADGSLELYAVGDNQDRVQRYTWSAQGFAGQSIHGLARSDITWGVLQCAPVALSP